MKGFVIKNILILVFLVGFFQNSNASDNFKADSIKICQAVYNFYDWYVASIKHLNDDDFMPRFVISDNGMTTLDLSNYLDNLRINGFSNALIKREEQSYSECMRNLEKVRFDTFKKTKFTDLEDYEQAKCDFGNYYRWTGQQEKIDGIKIKNVEFISDNKAIVTIIYYQVDLVDNKKHYWGKNSVIMIQQNDKWKIDNIKSWDGK